MKLESTKQTSTEAVAHVFMFSIRLNNRVRWSIFCHKSAVITVPNLIGCSVCEVNSHSDPEIHIVELFLGHSVVSTDASRKCSAGDIFLFKPYPALTTMLSSLR